MRMSGETLRDALAYVSGTAIILGDPLNQKRFCSLVES